MYGEKYPYTETIDKEMKWDEICLRVKDKFVKNLKDSGQYERILDRAREKKKRKVRRELTEEEKDLTNAEREKAISGKSSTDKRSIRSRYVYYFRGPFPPNPKP